MRAAGDAPATVRRLSAPIDYTAELANDVRAGLTADPKQIPSKYFYDAVGSDLFEQITELPEYYLTRAETEILSTCAERMMEIALPEELVELGSGASTKSRILIDAMRLISGGSRYVPIEISEDALTGAVRELCTDYPWLEVEGLVGDFHTDLGLVPRKGRRLLSFLGSTIGNFLESERSSFLAEISSVLQPGDHFLLGVDLVKSPDLLIAAYNDSAGVTAQFTRNVLSVLNRELGSDFEIEDFTHIPVWNAEAECMEAWLRADKKMTVKIEALEMAVELEAGEMIHTEVSCKFTAESIRAMFDSTELTIVDTFTDVAHQFGVVLARR